MMYTFLNVGLNEETTAGIASQTGNSWFAWDNYRRFLQCYGMSFNLERNGFGTIINEFKQRLSIPYKRGFPGKEMKKVALAYKDMIRDAGIDIIEDPFEQLYLAIKSVLGSWKSSKAKAYRAGRVNIPCRSLTGLAKHVWLDARILPAMKRKKLRF